MITNTFTVFELGQGVDEYGIPIQDYTQVGTIELQISINTITDVDGVNGLIYQLEQITGLVGGSFPFIEGRGYTLGTKLGQVYKVDRRIDRVLYLSRIQGE